MNSDSHFNAPVNRVIVIGTSAGGLDVLRQVVSRLPVDLPAALFIVQHLAYESVSILPLVLAESSLLPVHFPYDGQIIEPGHIYVAPPDLHLLLTRPGTITLNHGARENLHRPAIDPLFRSAARTYGPRTIGVILTGTMDDGVAGMLAIKLHGGQTVVQEPNGALYADLPRTVLEEVEGINYIVPASEIAPLLVQLAHQEDSVANVTSPPATKSERGNGNEKALSDMIDDTLQKQRRKNRTANQSVEDEPATRIEMMTLDSMPTDPLAVEPDVLICPECGGALAEIQLGNFVQYRCHTGHIFSFKSMEAAYAERVESALWAAMRALKESSTLNKRLAQRTNIDHLRVEYLRQADAAWAQARVIEELLAELGSLPYTEATE